MQPATSAGNVPAASLPWQNTQNLAEGLKNGQLSLTVVLGQLGAVMRDTLKVIEDFAAEQSNANLERKLKVERMEKLVQDLTEKCQGMQQALLYKEEKYDEKCREVERYKVICELSAKAAIDDDICYSSVSQNATRDENNNVISQQDRAEFSRPQMATTFHNPCGSTQRHIKSIETRSISGDSPHHSQNRRNLVGHTKIKDEFFPAFAEDNLRRSSSVVGQEERRSNRPSTSMASHYLGGPCRRDKPDDIDKNDETKIRERLGMMGGVNIESEARMRMPPRVDDFRQPTNYLDAFPATDDQRNVKIALMSQNNEVMSSSRNVVTKMRQKATESDLHRQVASGCWTRMSGRRRKDWPF